MCIRMLGTTPLTSEVRITTHFLTIYSNKHIRKVINIRLLEKMHNI